MKNSVLMFERESGQKHHTIQYLVIYAIEKTWDDWENCGLQGFHVIRKQFDVTLEEAYPSTHTVQHCLVDIQKHDTKFSMGSA